MDIRTSSQELDHAVGESHRCGGCRTALDFAFDYAFQPIVDLRSRTIFAHEALVRGPGGEPASTVLSRVTDANRYAFDQTCRVKAIRRAAELGMHTLLSINFLPNAVYQPESCIRSTLNAARRFGFPVERIVFEVTEGEKVDGEHLLDIFSKYDSMGFHTALDDFGAGYSGLDMLCRFQPSILKIDMSYVRDIHRSPAQQAIVEGIVWMARRLGAKVVAEGVETAAERDCLAALQIHLMQGFLFARPTFRALGGVDPGAW